MIEIADFVVLHTVVCFFEQSRMGWPAEAVAVAWSYSCC